MTADGRVKSEGPPASAWHWTSGTSQPSVALFEALRGWLELSAAEMYDLIVASEPGVAKYRAAIASANRKTR